ncbi:hypothetical protein [uncultured Eubacterium sp.]|uniref:hypothetical protein n=1 Tax=uncultured Eubacterium sp. TaxID=165185 RepID=UPI003267E966
MISIAVAWFYYGKKYTKTGSATIMTHTKKSKLTDSEFQTQIIDTLSDYYVFTIEKLRLTWSKREQN